MTEERRAVVIAGSGNIARYFIEEFVKLGHHNVHVVSRTDREFCHQEGVSFHQVKDYTTAAILPILNGNNAFAVVAALAASDSATYTSMHKALLDACTESQTCKRLVPSEYIGNLRYFEKCPRGSYESRKEFRQLLKDQSAVKWTLVNQGWLGDYFVLPINASGTYIRPFPSGWPIDYGQKTARVIDSGEQPVTFTASRDMAKAVTRLIAHEEWPDHTYVFGETTTWNKAIAKAEKAYGCSFKVCPAIELVLFGMRPCLRCLQRIPKSRDGIIADLDQTADEAKYYTATIDEWSLDGGSSVPMDEALQQRQRYFQGVHFRTIDEILTSAKNEEGL